MEYIVLASGSKGNATLLRSKNGILLIDLGITLVQFEKRAKPFNISLDDVDAVYIRIVTVITLNHLQNLMN